MLRVKEEEMMSQGSSRGRGFQRRGAGLHTDEEDDDDDDDEEGMFSESELELYEQYKAAGYQDLVSVRERPAARAATSCGLTLPLFWQVWHSEEEDAQVDSRRKKAVKVKHVKRREKKPEKKVRMIFSRTNGDASDDGTNIFVSFRNPSLLLHLLLLLPRLLKRRRSPVATKPSSATGSVCATAREEGRAWPRT